MSLLERFATGSELILLSYETDAARREAFKVFYAITRPAVDKGQVDGKPMKLGVIFIDQDEFNAFATRFEDADLIGVNRDVIPILLSLSRALVSQGHLLPERKTDGTVTAPIRLPVGLRAWLASSCFDIPALPDPARERVAQYVSATAMQYVLQHEFAHIYHGHIDWVYAQSGLRLVCESRSGSSDAFMGLERETLEWDADTGAVQRMMQHMIQARSDHRSGRAVWQIPDKNRFGSFQDAIDILISALDLCGLLFAVGDSDNFLNGAPRTHPHRIFDCYPTQIQLYIR